jgi:hypothetical protein
MGSLKVKESELKQITLFLVDTKVIFHPSISPNGFPDFSNHQGRKNFLILDRNILSPMIRLLKSGQLKDEYSLKVISSLMFWAQFNNLSVTSGLALSEYAHHKGGDNEANFEKDLFLKSFDHYAPDIWLNLALGRLKTIEPLTVDTSEKFSYNKEFDHYKMHYLEMLKIAQLYFDKSQSVEDKFTSFYKWVYENILMSKYTNSYLALLIGGQISTFKKAETFDQVIDRCKNQAWDLSYLSLWSTLYSKEQETSTNYLFGTLDRGMKEIFTSTYNESIDLHSSLFGNKIGSKINHSMRDTFKPRQRPEINVDRIDEMMVSELEKLKKIMTTYNSN